MKAEAKDKYITLRLTPTLYRALMRYCTANSITATAAASLALSEKLRKEKYLK